MCFSASPSSIVEFENLYLKIKIEENYGIYQFVIFFLQTFQNPIRPLTPSSLLDSICWSISEPSSSASVYTDSFSSEGVSEHHTPEFFDATGDGKESEASFANLTRPLSERSDHFLWFEINAFDQLPRQNPVELVVRVMLNSDSN